MNKKLAAALSGGAVLIVALTGCGGKSEGPDPKLGVWAKSVCDAVPAQDKKISAANASIAKIASDSDLAPKDAKETYAQAFQDMSEGYKAIADAISHAGAPPGVQDGAKRQQDAVKNLNDLSTSYADLKKKVDDLDTKDQGEFAKGLHDVADRTKAIGRQSDSGTEALKRLEQGDVREAIAEQPSCKASGSASAPAQAG
ncbi:small secreted protein [Streptomyces sp. NPDC004549]|uniref:small secreted protein n=1 Tax=unclassified Streptomyces TaxID=2593676 RepID=UPI0018F3E56E|nr:small secreted protein [Streptomyces sp. DSM 110735]MBJ7901694.1 small secreted protein [Streptomyces sp. DSM 110735]